MVTTQHITTAEQLFEAGDIGRCELVRGELIRMSPSSFRHVDIALRLGAKLLNYVESRGLGKVVGAEGGFVLERQPDTVRAPDVAFVRKDRLPPPEKEAFYFEGPPDLAVEVLSPSDRAGAVQGKVRQWLTAGCAAVWVVDPASRSVRVCHPDGEARVLSGDDHLEGGELLPGFTLPLAEIFRA